MTAHTHTGSSPPSLVAHAREWRVRFAGPTQLEALESLTEVHGSRPAAIRESARALAHCVDQMIARRAQPSQLEALRPGLIEHDATARQVAVRIPTQHGDRENMARIELAFAHANGARLTVSDLLRLIIVRGAELARAKTTHPSAAHPSAA